MQLLSKADWFEGLIQTSSLFEYDKKTYDEEGCRKCYSNLPTVLEENSKFKNAVI